LRQKRVKQEIYLEGNKGGDYIILSQSMEQKKNATCYIEVGHVCLIYISAIVPVEFITSLFASFDVSTNGKTLKDRILNSLPWDISYNEELANKVNENCK
jgi:hypothetical protein